MNEIENKFIVKRAEILAREFLTRRQDVVIHPLDDNDLHLVVALSPSASLKIQVRHQAERNRLLGASGVSEEHLESLRVAELVRVPL